MQVPLKRVAIRNFISQHSFLCLNDLQLFRSGIIRREGGRDDAGDLVGCRVNFSAEFSVPNMMDCDWDYWD